MFVDFISSPKTCDGCSKLLSLKLACLDIISLVLEESEMKLFFDHFHLFKLHDIVLKLTLVITLSHIVRGRVLQINSWFKLFQENSKLTSHIHFMFTPDDILCKEYQVFLLRMTPASDT